MTYKQYLEEQNSIYASNLNYTIQQIALLLLELEWRHGKVKEK